MPNLFWLLRWSDFADLQTLAVAISSATLAAVAGGEAARRSHVPEFGWAAALFGAATTLFSLMPSMAIFGSIGAGLYTIPAVVLGIESVLFGKISVVIATALGCSLVAWLLCLVPLSARALIIAKRRDNRSR